MIQAAAVLYAVVCGGVIVFQICLIAGAPWGRLTQGGTHPEALPRSGRVFAAISAVLLTLMAGSVLSAAGYLAELASVDGLGCTGNSGGFDPSKLDYAVTSRAPVMGSDDNRDVRHGSAGVARMRESLRLNPHFLNKQPVATCRGTNDSQ